MLIIATLIFLGILLMLIEILLVPGVGVAGILGLASLIGSSVYAFMYMSVNAGIITTLVVIALIAVMLFIILRAKTWKKFGLNTEIDSKVNDDPEKVAVGQEGKTITRLAPMGTARFNDITCEVRSEDNSLIAPGQTVCITSIEDNKIFVKPLNQ